MEAPEVAACPPAPTTPPGPSRCARMLGLSHYIEQLVSTGVVKNYAEVARRLGTSRARVAQIVRLAFLDPATQEDILLGRSTTTERQLRQSR